MEKLLEKIKAHPSYLTRDKSSTLKKSLPRAI
jgi:hypothetical protein